MDLLRSGSSMIQLLHFWPVFGRKNEVPKSFSADHFDVNVSDSYLESSFVCVDKSHLTRRDMARTIIPTSKN